MKITVLNGSPKGEISATLQYINFIRKKFPEIELTVHHVSKKIKLLEKNPTKFREIVNDVEEADAVWWSVPIYVFVVPSQYKRFIELIRQNDAEESFRDKYTAVFTTSIHFYDHTGVNYMHAICDDLGMKFVDFHSADMYDLTKENERQRLLDFADQFLATVRNCEPTVRVYEPLRTRSFSYSAGSMDRKVDTRGRKILLLADRPEPGSNLEGMIQRFMDALSDPVERFNLDEIGIKGGCLGCIKCGFDNECAYENSDDYIRFYRETVVPADIVVFAGNMVDRYLSAAWKQFIDRRFFNTHIPTMSGKHIGYIISGPLGQEANLREILSAMSEMDHANLTGIVTDEFGDSGRIDSLLDQLASRLVKQSLQGYSRPETFLGIAGRKVFRDAIWSRLRFPFLADFKYYSENGYFDFPQDDKKSLEQSLEMIEAIKDPETRKVIRKSLNKGMVAPLQHIVETR